VPPAPPARQQPPDAPPIARTGAGDPPPAEPVRLVSGPPQRPAPGAALPGACLVVEKVAPPTVAPGKPLAYEIVVRNVGGAEALRVRVEEQVPAGAALLSAEPRPEVRGNVLAWDLGNLAAGAEARLRVALQPPAEGDVTITATVTSATVSTLRAHFARTGLSLTVTGPPPARVGDAVTFTVQLANNTATALRGAVLRAPQADGLRHPAGNQLEAVVPVLAPGEVKSVPLEVAVTKAGRLSLSASVSASGVDPGSGEAVVEVSDAAAPPAQPAGPPAPAGAKPTDPAPLPPLPPLPPADPARPEAQAAPRKDQEKPVAPAGGAAVTFDLKDADQALEVGRETTYEIRVLNQGTAPTRDVLVRAVVPEEMVLVRADDPAGRAAQVRGREVAFEPLASLGARGEAVYHVRVKALKPGDGRFTASLRCAAMARPLSQEVSTRVYTDEAPAQKPGGR
jgi:uncharacterized repeat protein (TIGR01451 family)